MKSPKYIYETFSAYIFINQNMTHNNSYNFVNREINAFIYLPRKSMPADKVNSSKTFFAPSLLNYFPVKNDLNV